MPVAPPIEAAPPPQHEVAGLGEELGVRRLQVDAQQLNRRLSIPYETASSMVALAARKSEIVWLNASQWLTTVIIFALGLFCAVLFGYDFVEKLWRRIHDLWTPTAGASNARMNEQPKSKMSRKEVTFNERVSAAPSEGPVRHLDTDDGAMPHKTLSCQSTHSDGFSEVDHDDFNDVDLTRLEERIRTCLSRPRSHQLKKHDLGHGAVVGTAMTASASAAMSSRDSEFGLSDDQLSDLLRQYAAAVVTRHNTEAADGKLSEAQLALMISRSVHYSACPTLALCSIDSEPAGASGPRALEHSAVSAEQLKDICRDVLKEINNSA